MNQGPTIQDPRFYGRRVGRQAAAQRARLSEILPKWVLTLPQLKETQSLEGLFDKPCAAYWLEIGFGSGEHALAHLKCHANIGLIGAEPFIDGLLHFLKEVEREPLLYEGRLRVIPEDVRLFLPFLPHGNLSKIFVLFSDPWPKKRHHKRRLITAPFLETCGALLQEGGELIVAHDHGGYMLEVLELLNAHQTFVWKEGVRTSDTERWPSWPPDWPLTRYGAKALAQGRPLAFCVWEKTSRMV